MRELWRRLFRRTPPTTGDVLDKAANLIEKHGWRRGQYGRPGYGFCISGAISHAGLKLGADTTDAFRTAGGLLPPPPPRIVHMTLEVWNDYVAISKSQVTAFLCHCANTWREEEGKRGG